MMPAIASRPTSSQLVTSTAAETTTDHVARRGSLQGECTTVTDTDAVPADATTASATAKIDAAIDALLAACDPRSTDRITFRGARFDHGLAWVHFDEGFGGLGLRPDLNRH